MLHHWQFLWKMCLTNVLLICMTFGLSESNQSQSFCNILQVCSLILSTVSHTFKATHCGLAVLAGRGFDRVWLWNLTSSMIRDDQVWQVALWRKRRRRLPLDEGRLLSGRLPWFSSHPVMFPQLLSDGYYHLQISCAEVFVGYWICLSLSQHYSCWNGNWLNLLGFMINSSGVKTAVVKTASSFVLFFQL